jgi:hypothetical protein
MFLVLIDIDPDISIGVAEVVSWILRFIYVGGEAVV